MEHLSLHIESLIFVADQALSKKDILATLETTFESKIHERDFEEAIGLIRAKYGDENHAIELVNISGGYQFLTKEQYHHTVGTLLKQQNKKKLSKSAMETLSIIAYRQPVTKGDLELIRGVNCDYAVNKLLEKELVEIHGRSEGPGRPLLYTTSRKFMDYFGLESMSDMPKLKDLELPEQQIGEQEALTVNLAPTPLNEEE